METPPPNTYSARVLLVQLCNHVWGCMCLESVCYTAHLERGHMNQPAQLQERKATRSRARCMPYLPWTWRQRQMLMTTLLLLGAVASRTEWEWQTTSCETAQCGPKFESRLLTVSKLQVWLQVLALAQHSPWPSFMSDELETKVQLKLGSRASRGDV